MSLLGELKRRKVFRVGTAYAVLGWLIIQVIDTVLPTFGAPDWVSRTLMFIIILGFPVTLVLAWAFELSRDGVRLQSVLDQDGQPEVIHVGMGLIAALVLALLAAGGGTYLWMASAGDRSDATGQATSDSAPQPSAPVEGIELEKSIAVLPFEDFSPDGDQAYFADGLSEELVHKLAQVSDLLVVARTSSFTFRDSNEDLRSISQKLSVSYILEGSVRKAGDDLRITAQLIRGEDQSHLWSGNFDRKLEDIFATQDEIAQGVTRALNITLGTGEFDRPGMTRNVAAYEALMKMSEIDSRNTRDAVVQAIGGLRDVIRLDPNFGLAWLYLYGLYDRGAGMFPPGEADEFPELATEALAMAAELAPDMPELQMIYVDRAMDAGDWLEADRRLTALLEQHPNNDEIMTRYANFLFLSGRIRDVIPVAERALRLDPLSFPSVRMVIQARVANGDFDRALQEIERNRELMSARGHLSNRASVAWQRGDVEEYARQARAYYGAEYYDGTDPQGQRFMMKFLELLEADDADYARQEVDRLLVGGEFGRGQLISLAGIANHYGDADWQAELIEQFAGNRTSIADWLPRSAIYRQTDAFSQRMQRNGLADYWRMTGKWPDKCRPLPDSGTAFECF